MNRPYSADVQDISDIKAGDQEAMLRLLTAYSPIMRKVSYRFSSVIPVEDGMQIAAVAILELAISIDPAKASHIRSIISAVISDAMNTHLAGSVSATTFKKAKAAHDAMRARLHEGAPQLSLQEAASEFKVSPEYLYGFVALQSPTPLFAAAWDDEDEYDIDPYHNAQPFPVDSSAQGDLYVSESITEAIHALPMRQREVVTLSVKGMSEADIADELGISVKSVRTHKTRGYDALRKRLSA